MRGMVKEALKRFACVQVARSVRTQASRPLARE